MNIPGEFAQPVLIINPGETATPTAADLWQGSAGSNGSGGGFDEEGTLQAVWTGVFPPGSQLEPLAEVLDVESGRWFWVAALPETRRDLLTGLPDHVEALLNTVYRQLVVVDVLRDANATDANDLGDGVETTPAVHLAGVAAAITEVTRKVPTTDADLRTVHVVVGWLPAGTDVQRGDRIRVPAGDPDGEIYSVDAVTQPIQQGLLDLRLDLTRTS